MKAVIFTAYGDTAKFLYDEVLIIDPTPPFTREEYEQDAENEGV